MSAPQERQPGKTFADRLNHLFATVRAPHGGEHSNEHVAQIVAARTGATCSREYIRLLRAGERTNPTVRHVQALADVFGVPVAYFFDDQVERDVNQDLEARQLQDAMRDAGVRHVAHRMVGLSDASLRTVLDVVEHVRKLEGLAEQEPPDAVDDGASGAVEHDG